MSNIRKQSIKGTLWVYLGFGIGAIITYIFTHQNWFTPKEYGLTKFILENGILVAAFASMGTNLYIYKLFPYYKENIEPKKNDLLGTAIKIVTVGFVFVSIALWLIKPLVKQKYQTNSPLLVEYFYLLIPAGFIYLLLFILESYAFAFKKAVTISFLKEVVVRIYTLALILLKVFGLINFNTFIYLYILQCIIVVVILSYILYKENNLWISFKTSHVTKKYKKIIINILLLTGLTIIISTARGSIDSILIPAKKNLDGLAIFGLVSYMAIIMTAPLRTLVGVTIPILSVSWKEKNYAEIERIYKRTSINMLAFALFIFFLFLLNFEYAINFLNLNPIYLTGKNVFIILGIVNIIELGTGVNGQIIGTSSFFRFELWTSILLTALIIPLSYFLTDKYGILGPAYANLISFTIYNSIRYIFLWKKFNMQPFTIKTLELLLIAAVSFTIVHFSFTGKEGLIYLILRSALFCILFAVAVYVRNISPDVKQVLETIKKRFV
jgi:O-antigen/teichoic acid export membrane protein